MRLPDEIFLTSCISACVIFWVLNQGLYTRDVSWGNGRRHSTTTVIVFQGSRSTHELSEPPGNSGFGCGVTVSASAFLACNQCYCSGSSLAWGLNLRAVVCGIFLRVLWFPPLLHRFNGSANKIKFK